MTLRRSKKDLRKVTEAILIVAPITEMVQLSLLSLGKKIASGVVRQVHVMVVGLSMEPARANAPLANSGTGMGVL